MRLSSDALVYWDLLSKVTPAFIQALSPDEHTQNSRRHFPIIKGYLEAISCTLLQDVNLYHDIGESDFVLLEGALQKLLLSFEGFVQESVLQEFRGPSAADSVQRSYNDDVQLTIDIPRLNALSNLEQACRNSRDRKSKPHLLRYISFEVSSEQLISLKRAAESLDEVVETTFTQLSEEENVTPSEQLVNLSDQDINRIHKVKAFSEAADILFDLLIKEVGRCAGDADLHNVKLRLGRFDKLRWDMLISTCTTAKKWHPLVCSHQARKTTTTTTTSKLSIEVCHRVKDSRRHRKSLHLCLYEDQLLFESTACDHIEVSCQSLPYLIESSLEQLLEADRESYSPDKTWRNFYPGERRKIAAILACSILYLYDSPWLERIDTDTIQFVCNSKESDSRRLNGPYVTKSLSIHSKPNRSADPLHQHAIIAEFGIFLSELESGQKFEPCDEDKDYDTQEFSLFLMLDRILREPSIKRGVEYGYLSVIQACLDFDELVKALYHPDLRGQADISAAQIKCRAAIIKHILKPLVAELQRTYPDAAEDLPDIPQYLIVDLAQDLAAVNTVQRQNVAGNSLGYEGKTMKRHLNVIPESPYQSRNQSQPSPLRQVIQSLPSELSVTNSFALFEDKTIVVPKGDERIARYRLFAGYFKEFLEIRMKPNAGQTRIKIAILDTGIDDEDDVFAYQRDRLKKQRPQSDGSFSDPIRATKSFAGTDVVDSNGHGTHIATLLMVHAPQSDLYIAKIAHTSSVEHVEHIAEAIDWAVQQQVDIITMSFGMSEISVAPEVMQRIQRAIGMANLRNILLFAAASNCAGNGPRTYPALDLRVTCVHAVDGKGFDDGGLNPAEGYYRDRFATLGVAIECSWEGRTTYRSGTSYATPILAAIAANILSYAANAVVEGMLQQRTFDKLHTQAGIERMFHLMSTRINNTHDYIAPWLLWTQRATDQSICSKLDTELY